MECFCDDVLPCSSMRGDDGYAASEGFENGEAEAFIAADGGDESHAAHDFGQVVEGLLADEKDALSEACSADRGFELGLVGEVLFGRFAANDDCVVGEMGQHFDGGFNEEIDAFGGAHTTEDANAVLPWVAELCP